MAGVLDRKLYLGPRLRVLRRELGINQTQMADELGVSPSYLNHLERNQRPLTAQMLLRLANTYDIDVRDFVAGGSEAAATDLHATFADGLLRDLGIPRQELNEIADAHPGVAEGVGRLYRALGDLRRLPDALERAADADAPALASPIEWLRDHARQRRNHIAELDEAAEAIAAALPDNPADLWAALKTRLAEQHRIGTWLMPAKVMPGAVRHYDLHRRRLMIAEAAPLPTRLFALAYQTCLMELEPLILQLVERDRPADTDTRTLAKVAFAQYAAAALVMPYGRLIAAAEDSRYDLPFLAARFGVSFEQLAQRLTTLDRSGARGLPFFFLKVDAAGQVAKRIMTDAFPFARHGGTCPRWPVAHALRAPGEVMPSLVESPDGKRAVILAIGLVPDAWRGAKAPQVIALGCDAKLAAGIVHADGLGEAPITIGPSCGLCERTDCPDRAGPPVARALQISQHRRSSAPYPFRKA